MDKYARIVITRAVTNDGYKDISRRSSNENWKQTKQTKIGNKGILSNIFKF